MIEPDLTVHSPNYNPWPVMGSSVVIHSTRSGKSMYAHELTGTINWMLRPGTVSSHWIVSRTGEAVRVVPDYYQAWHAGTNNPHAWGIELEQGVESDGFTEPQIAKLREIMWAYHVDEGVPWRRVREPSEAGFTGHEDTNQGHSYGKSDPGELFPWDTIFQPFKPRLLTEIGLHHTDGTEFPIWDAGTDPLLEVDRIGARFSDGTFEYIWLK